MILFIYLHQSRVVPWLPNVVFGVMCLIAAIMTLLLPETLGRPLPQTIEEVERWTRTLRYTKIVLDPGFPFGGGTDSKE